MEQSRERWDVIVIGAGVSGLSAAESLGKAGLRVLLLEARERIGGRIYSLPGVVPEHAIELGAEFVHGKPKQLDQYLREHGLQLRESGGTNYCEGANGLSACEEPPVDLFEELDKLDPATFADEPLDDILQHRFADAPPEARLWASHFVEGFDAADPHRVSTHSLIVEQRAENEIEGDRSFHVIGGYHRLVETMQRERSAAVEVRTGTLVTAIRWSGQAVTVKARRSAEELQFTAAQVAITLPLGVLQQKPPADGAIVFEPALAEKHDALSRLSMGPVNRVVLQFDSPFWEDRKILGDKALPDLHFLFSLDKVFPTYWTGMPVRDPLLVAWAAGPAAAVTAHLTSHDMETAVVNALSRVLSIPADKVRSRLVRSYHHDWQQDPFSRGAYSYVLAGGMGAQQELARPLGKQLFFAGEATQSDGHHGTVHGAFASGRRVAKEIIESRKL